MFHKFPRPQHPEPGVNHMWGVRACQSFSSSQIKSERSFKKQSFPRYQLPNCARSINLRWLFPETCVTVYISINIAAYCPGSEYWISQWYGACHFVTPWWSKEWEAVQLHSSSRPPNSDRLCRFIIVLIRHSVKAVPPLELAKIATQ